MFIQMGTQQELIVDNDYLEAGLIDVFHYIMSVDSLTLFIDAIIMEV